MAGLAGGGFVVTWLDSSQDGSGWGVFGQAYDAGGAAQGGEFQINTYTAGVQWDASVAALAGGGFVVTWRSDHQDGSSINVYGQAYDASGSAQGGEFLVNTYTAGGGDPSVAGLPDGGFVVTWTGGGIFGQRFGVTTLPPIATGHDTNLTVGQSIGLAQLFSYSDPNPGVSIVSFSVDDLTLGSGYLTLQGVRLADSTLFDHIPISQIEQWAYFAMDGAVSPDKIGFSVYDSTGLQSPRATAIVTPIAPLPDALTLAKISAAVYSNNGLSVASLGGRYEPVEKPPPVYDAGLFGEVFQNGNQIVVAFRGTELANLFNDLADGSWATNSSNAILQQYVADAANFLSQVETQFPADGYNITLTGHSLGGAIAQLLGNASGLPTVTFNAPGAALFASALSTQLAPILNPGVITPAITNYRVYGDQVSLVGTPFGGTLTETLIPTRGGDPTPSLLLTYHSIDTVVMDLTFPSVYAVNTSIYSPINGWQPPLPDPRSSYFLASGAAGTAVDITLVTGQAVVDIGAQATHWFAVTAWNSVSNFSLQSAGLMAASNASAGTDALLYQVVENPGSPQFASFALPGIPGIAAWAVGVHDGSGWSAYEILQPGVVFTPGSSFDAVRFFALDANNHQVAVTDPMILGIGFASAGQFIGEFDTQLPPPAAFAVVGNTAPQQESHGGSTAYIFTVTRTGAILAAGTVDWAVTGSGANPTNAADFTGGPLPSGILSFAVGQTSQTITVNVAGDSKFEPDEGFAVTLSNPSGGAILATASAVGTILGDGAFPNLIGTIGNDTIDATASTINNVIDVSQGGVDIVTGGSGDDLLLLGTTLTGATKVNGGAGFDTVVLSGDYSPGLALGKITLTNVEEIVFEAGNNYSLNTKDTTVAAGASLVVDASALASINSATVNGKSEKSSSIIFLGGAGHDVFTGGGGADVLIGDLGADILAGGKGANVFVYASAEESPLQTSFGAIDVTGDDTLIKFQATFDKIDLSEFDFGGPSAAVITKSIIGFSTTLAAGTDFYGSAGVAAEYASSGKTARVYVDANHDGNLGAGDMLIQLTGVAKNGLTAASFTF